MFRMPSHLQCEASLDIENIKKTLTLKMLKVPIPNKIFLTFFVVLLFKIKVNGNYVFYNYKESIR